MVHLDDDVIVEWNSMATESAVASWLLQMVIPHRITLQLDVDRHESTSTVSLLIAPRRLGPVAARMVRDLLRPVMGSAGESDGKEANGAFVFRSEMPLSPDALAAGRSVWQKEPTVPLKLHGYHPLEAIVRNDAGGAYLAISSLGLATDSQRISDQDSVEKQQIFDARQLSGLFYRFSRFTLAANVVDQQWAVRLNVNCPTDITARQTEFILMTVRDVIFRELLTRGFFFEGEIVRENKTVNCYLTIVPLQQTGGTNHAPS